MDRLLVVFVLLATACDPPYLVVGSCGVHTDGTLHISPSAEDLAGCSFTQADGRVSINGYDSAHGELVSFVAPAGVGAFHCVPGTDLITILYRDRMGARFSATSSDGSDLPNTGDCTITAEVSDELHWSGHIDATLALEGSNGTTIPFSADAALTHL